MRFRLVLPLVLLLILLAPVAAAAAPAGDVRLFKGAGLSMDQFMIGATPERRAWFRETYTRMKGYAPWFDDRLSWYSDAWAYQDLYAVYTDGRAGEGRKEPFILRTSGGERLYIPWGCDGSTCPQYAADPGSRAFQDLWIREARRKLAAGYRGLYVDDASLALFVGDADGELVKPVDPRTGREMTKSAWRGYVLAFLERIRRAFPRAEIVHNSLWWVAPLRTRYMRRQARAADWLLIEHAFVDGGMTGGSGPLSFRAYFDYLTGVQRMGRRLVIDSDGASPERRELLLAGYLMVNSGRDLLSSWEGTMPDDIWNGFKINLGAALGSRRRWRGVWRRDFQRGIALVSDPGTSPRTLPVSGRRLSGEAVEGVTLGDRQGAVVLR